jgi:hypothetical protein
MSDVDKDRQDLEVIRQLIADVRAKRAVVVTTNAARFEAERQHLEATQKLSDAWSQIRKRIEHEADDSEEKK